MDLSHHETFVSNIREFKIPRLNRSRASVLPKLIPAKPPSSV